MNLQHMAMVSIGQSAWQTAPIKRRIRELFSTEIETEYETTRFFDWTHVARKIYDKLKQNLLPLRLTHELLYVVKQMGDDLYNWYDYVERANKYLHGKCGQTLDHPSNIYWTSSGTIDVDKVIFDNWIRNVRLEHACAVYFMSILHGLDKRRTDGVWNLMPAQMKITCRLVLSCKESYASAFLYACIGDPSQSLEIARMLLHPTVEPKQRFLLFVSTGYFELVKSVWYQLDRSTRNGVADRAFRLAIRQSDTCNGRFETTRYDEIALFLYCQMSDQCRSNILCSTTIHYVTRLLCILASRPHLGLLMPTLEQVLSYILEEMDYVYTDFVHSLIYDMLEDFDCVYVPRGTLVKVWNRLPTEIKREIRFDEVLKGLVEEWDLISLRILLNVPEFADEKERFIQGLVRCYLKAVSEEGSDRLDELAESVFALDSDMEYFKRKVRDGKTLDLVGN